MHCGSVFSHEYVKSNPNLAENATWKLTVLHCFGQYFCLHFEEFELGLAPVYIAFLCFMGDDNEAKELQLQPRSWSKWPENDLARGSKKYS